MKSFAVFWTIFIHVNFFMLRDYMIYVRLQIYSIDISKLEKILYLILAASPLASSSCSAIGDWKGFTLSKLLCP